MRITVTREMVEDSDAVTIAVMRSAGYEFEEREGESFVDRHNRLVEEYSAVLSDAARRMVDASIAEMLED